MFMKVCFFLGGGGGGRETREGLRMEESCSVTVAGGSIPRFERKPSEAASDLSKVVEKNGQKQLLGPLQQSAFHNLPCWSSRHPDQKKSFGIT